MDLSELGEVAPPIFPSPEAPRGCASRIFIHHPAQRLTSMGEPRAPGYNPRPSSTTGIAARPEELDSLRSRLAKMLCPESQF
jgi:hypothetical protein